MPLTTIVPSWKLATLSDVLAAGAAFESRWVTTVDEAEDALQRAAEGGKCVFIEIMMPRMDTPASLIKLGSCLRRAGLWQELGAGERHKGEVSKIIATCTASVNTIGEIT